MKKTKTLVEQAIEAVPGFGQSYEKFHNSMLAGGRSVKSIDNYGRKIAVVALRFGALPESLTTHQVNAHLAEMRSSAKCPSMSEFKHTIFGLRALRIEDVDSDRMLLRVRAGKNRKDRYAPLAGCLLEGLRKYYLAERPDGYLFNGYLPGTPISEKGAGWIMREALKKAGIRKRVTMHTLRHSYATHLLEMGMDILRVKELMEA